MNIGELNGFVQFVLKQKISERFGAENLWHSMCTTLFRCVHSVFSLVRCAQVSCYLYSVVTIRTSPVWSSQMIAAILCLEEKTILLWCGVCPGENTAGGGGGLKALWLFYKLSSNTETRNISFVPKVTGILTSHSCDLPGPSEGPWSRNYVYFNTSTLF